MQDEASSPPPARILIVDDHDLVREGIRLLLAKEPDVAVVGEAKDGLEAVELCRSLGPDLVLMDVRMPKMDGLEATRAIKEERPRTSVLMVTSHEHPGYLLEAIRAGAAGYVLKDATKPQLLDAVRRVLGGDSPLNQELAMRLLRRLAEEEAVRRRRRGRRPVRREPPPPAAAAGRQEEEGEPLGGSPPPEEALTAREVEVLRVLAMGKTNREIARSLALGLSTVKAYVRRIIDKLGVSDRTQAAVRAAELGLLSDQEEEGEW